jgi:inosose dehydratase
LTPASGERSAQQPGTGEIAIANAPVSYGAFEITVGVYDNVPDPITLLDAVSSAGYEGVDLGPVGYLGTGHELAERLGSRGLSLAGGYLELPFSEPEKFAEALPSLDLLLDVFAVVPDGRVQGRPTLADAGSRERAAYPGRAATDRTVGLDDRGWRNFADGLARAVERCRERGYEPTFHHHTATYIEAQWEIERLLELSDVGVTLDSGHLLLGGGDPVKAVHDWPDRINHVHLKDARQDVLDAIVEARAPVMEIWTRKAFCPLGEGDVAIDDVLAGLREIGYDGWLVVEQDTIPAAGESVDKAAGEQARNREYLRERGL